MSNREELDELRQENLRLKNELHYANTALATLKYKGINTVTVTLDEVRNISENPPNVDVRNYHGMNEEMTVEW